MMQFIDISKSILYDMERAHNSVLSMINACVSHEMRNPLNSVIAQNIEKKEIYNQLNELTLALKDGHMTQEKFLEKHKEMMGKLNSGWKIQYSSANILAFIVQDLLDYAQIKQGKFRKNIQEFNVISAVEDVMLIQQRKAEDNHINFHATFENIKQDGEHRDVDLQFLGNSNSFMVNTDQQRVMQVLLGLQSNALKFTEGGDVHIKVKIEEEFLHIAIQDTGVGISEQN